ncbi:MAG TPA: helix-hairpin-helix domain-containing protein [Ramlibacter sp.]
MLKKILAILAFLMTAAVAMAAVDAHKATEAELDSVKGIGPGTSKLIVNERKKGDFKDWNDFITRVKGVGEKRATSLSDAGLTVGGKPYAHTAATAKTGDKATKVEDKNARADTKAAKDEAKADAKAMKAEAKADKESAKAGAKAEKAKVDAKEAKAEAAADAKADKANAKK